jgi:hypothetical protein
LKSLPVPPHRVFFAFGELAKKTLPLACAQGCEQFQRRCVRME